MKRLLLLCTFILAQYIAATKTLDGVVLDENGQPLEFASVMAFSDTTFVNGTVTDSNGAFRFDDIACITRLRIGYLGYEAAEVNVTEYDGRLLEVVMQRETNIMDEVVVKAPYIQRQADRIVLNMAANPLSANKDAHELLKTAPGVWVTDETLSVYGQSGIAVYIDDRKVNMSGGQLMSYLKSIQSESIATIEIIPKAGAEYSADSSGGIIRINLRRNRIDGLNGTTGLNVTAGEYKQWLNPFFQSQSAYR